MTPWWARKLSAKAAQVRDDEGHAGELGREHIDRMRSAEHVHQHRKPVRPGSLAYLTGGQCVTPVDFQPAKTEPDSSRTRSSTRPASLLG
jgi:hypothetical protein